MRTIRYPPTDDEAYDPDLIEVDLQILFTACACLELISAKKEATEAMCQRREATTAPMEEMLDFAEYAMFPKQWEGKETSEEDEASSRIKIFAAAKASLLRAAVEVAAELEFNDLQNAGFWSRMQRWLQLPLDDKESRTDLVGCASLCYGNFARSGE